MLHAKVLLVIPILLQCCFNLIIITFQEVERLSKELSDSKTNYEELSKQVVEMKVTNNSLKELVNTSQEALSKEQNIVKCFQDQIPSNKVSFWSSFYILDCHFLFLFLFFYVFVLLQGDISISSTRADVSLVSTGAKSEASFGSRTSKSSRKSVHHIQGQFYGAKLSAGAAVGFLQIKG